MDCLCIWLVGESPVGFLFPKIRAYPDSSAGKESACTADPWIWNIPWRRKWQPTPEFLPGKSHGRKSLEGSSPQGRKESDTTKHENEQMKVECVSHSGDGRF